MLTSASAPYLVHLASAFHFEGHMVRVFLVGSQRGEDLMLQPKWGGELPLHHSTFVTWRTNIYLF